MTVTRRQVASHAASAAVGAVVALVIVISLQGAFPPGGPPAPSACPAGSEFSRTFDAGPRAGWRACITYLPGGTDFSLWNVSASWDEQNDSVISFVYRLNVDIPYEAILHENISYLEPHEPVVFWNTTQASTGGLHFAGEMARFELYIPSLLYSGDDLSVVKEVRYYLGKHEPPIYDPSNEPHQIVSDILSVSFLPPEP